MPKIFHSLSRINLFGFSRSYPFINRIFVCSPKMKNKVLSFIVENKKMKKKLQLKMICWKIKDIPSQ